MNPTIFIDLGNVWDILSAIGTIGATVIALYLLFDERKRKISGVFVWDTGTQYAPQLVLCNNGAKVIAIKQIDFVYQRKKYIGKDFTREWKSEEFRILLPNESKRIPITLPTELHTRLKKIENDNTTGLKLSDNYIKLASKPNPFVVKITDSTRKTFRIKLAYSQRELLENFFGKMLSEA